MIPVLHYFNPIVTKTAIISVDNLVIDYVISKAEDRQKLLNKLSAIPILQSAEVIHWDSFKPGTFRDQFSIRMVSGVSFWIGIALNGSSVSKSRCRLEANPNKVGQEPVFWEMLDLLNSLTRPVTRYVKRFDLAIDIPVPRVNCFLIKDRRMYIERRHGVEFTQYLGAKSSRVGRVKLYNKQAECELEEPLTRLELTLDLQTSYANVNWPAVYYLEQKELDLSGIRLTDTDRFILRMILQGHGSLAELGRKTKKKMALLVDQQAKKVEISKMDYEVILKQVQTYVQGDAKKTSEIPAKELAICIRWAVQHAHLRLNKKG